MVRTRILFQVIPPNYHGFHSAEESTTSYLQLTITNQPEIIDVKSQQSRSGWIFSGKETGPYNRCRVHGNTGQ